ncbi:MAG: hypothetical protein KA746_14720 [Pyrinomonadaceae bacterium]|nr:hypothetical protein [Pyrinomonadaceae bacterium]
MRSLGYIFVTTLLLSISMMAQGSWVVSSTPEKGDLVAAYFTSATRGFVAGDAGYLASTNDGGKTWTKYPLNTPEDINEIYFRNENNGYLVAGRKMFITRDGGRTWQETRIFGTGQFSNGTPEFLSIRFADKKRGVVVGSILNKEGDVIDSLAMKTEDGGESWQRITVPSKKELIHLDFNGSSHGWIVGDEGVIFATTDGAKTWRAQSSGTRMPLYNVDFHDDNEGYAVGKSGTILRTENGGANWERVTTNFRDTFLRVDFADDKNGWIVGYNGTILRSPDKGRTWVRQESNTRAHLYGLFITKKYGCAVGAAGTIVEYLK